VRSLFVTGTDTGVGKTFVTAGIVRSFVNSGINAVPAKPVQTGCVNGIADDLEFSVATAGLILSDEIMKRLCPLRFAPACSPHLAAEQAKTCIDVSVSAEILRDLSLGFDCIVAEGAGGILVPLGGGKTMIDLMLALGWPVLLVSPDKLGTINHTLLSIQVLRSAGLEVCGVVISHVSPSSALPGKSNARAISEYGSVEILGEIPYSPESFPADSFTVICDKLRGFLKHESQGK
jgi:dethiobiotin synthase